jgi:S1-C subfamily serine protease
VSCGSSPQSAYDLAVANGYVGTEEQWLASLKGQDLTITDIYASAVAEGYTGDFLTFLTEYLQLDAEMIADAIVKYEEKDPAQTIALPLLSSVSIQCSSSGTSTGVTPVAGSGVIYSMSKNEGEAYIITNYHVVSYTTASDSTAIHQSISVFLYGADKTTANAIKATYIGGSSTYDIAVLKVSGSDYLRNSDAVPIKAANSDDVLAGQEVLAIGNALGHGISVTHGIISVDSKQVQLSTDGETKRLIQIDAAINEGNSGGGMYNSAGELIGIINAKISADGVESVGYAIPSNIALRVAESLIDAFEEKSGDNVFVFESDTVSLSVAHLGITMGSTDLRAEWDQADEVVRIRETVVIDSIESSSLAKNLSLKSGDIIDGITVDGTYFKVERTFTLHDAMLLCRVDSTVTISYVRDAKAGTVTFTTPASCFQTVD